MPPNAESPNVGGQFKNLPPNAEDSNVGGQVDDLPEYGATLPTGKKIRIKGRAYILTYSKPEQPIRAMTGWYEIKKDGNNLSLRVRWREVGRKKSQYLGTLIVDR